MYMASYAPVVVSQGKETPPPLKTKEGTEDNIVLQEGWGTEFSNGTNESLRITSK